ncbi:MAG: primosomal protein N' [Blastocatellia bacterium]|nr:MAG: primosomal protein N' [Blastocatellia bacterium]
MGGHEGRQRASQKLSYLLTLLIQVAVPIPTLDLLTYSVPPGLAPVVGARVVVPVGTRVVTGVIVELNVRPAGIDEGGIKPIRQLLDSDVFVPPGLVALARWTAEYYAAGAGETITAVLPPKARGAQVSGHKTVRIAAITPSGIEMLAADASAQNGDPKPEGPVARLAGRQLRALELLAGSVNGIPTPRLADEGIASDTLARLVGRGLISTREERVDRDPFAAGALQVAATDPDRPLTQEQSAALERLARLAKTQTFQVALLHGVTASGKTEIFMRLSAIVRQAERTVLVLVPEIGLTPATASLFRHTFSGRVAVLHSGLSDGERHDEWQRIRRGEVDVVVGTRSAVFAPIPRLGLIVVDEEHDSSYKQEESPRYHGRDVAIVRAQHEHALVILASATPSMESYHNAVTGRYERVVLERRVRDRPLPAVTIVDMREEYAAFGADVVISRVLAEGIRNRLTKGEQALVLLNRRGFATGVFCRQCAGTLDCPNCSVSLVVHGEGSVRWARCHYCNYSRRVPSACPLCAGPYLEQTGFGTERVEAEIARSWPDARVARLDRDSTRRKGALAGLLRRFREGDLDILVGTQMIAKGHDFPRVTLVGVISADVGLGMADFRASERTFQLLTQVAGRAGRGDEPGEAIIQTLYPGHYSIQLACKQDYPAFFERELQFRHAMRYPPAVSLINAIIRGRTFAGAMDDASEVAQQLRRVASAGGGLHVLGPAPAPIGKLRGEYRAQLLVKGRNRKRMREAVLAAIAARPDIQRRAIVDVDPVSVL